MNKVKSHFKNNWKEYAGALCVFTLILLAIAYGYRIWHLDLNIPMAYYGADDIHILVNAKMLETQNWVLSTDRLGAPYTTDLYDFTANMMHNVDVITLKFFLIFTHNAAAAVNLTFLSTFFVTGLISYFVMRELNITHWVAVTTSSVFGVSSFMVMRGIEHIVLAECYFLPLSILLCFWIYERDEVFRFDKNFFKVKRNYLAILFVLLIANNGIAYYPFFTCFMLLVTAISKLLKTGKWRYVVRALVAVFGVCLFVVLSILPGVIYNHINGVNTAAISRGGFVESEYYGLKIIQLFLPIDGHGIRILEKAITRYNSETMLVHENITSYIGIVAILGFVILMFTLFIKKDSKLKERFGLLSELNIMLILLGTTSGLGTIFAFLISDKLRAYNRISIVIEYVCILGFALALDYVYRRWNENKAKRWKPMTLCCVGSLFIMAAMFIDFPTNYIPNYEGNKEKYLNDEAFAGKIEDSVDAGSMIFQLPYHEYPEGGAVNNMADYELFAGFLHSDTLRWSYGAVKGRDGSYWNQDVAAMNYPDMIAELRNAGFAGIYIDRRAYEDTEWKQMEAQLTELLGQQPMVSDNGYQSFFKM